MSVTLKLSHIEGLRIRQQQASKVERTDTGAVLHGAEWRFEPDDVKQDEDLRKLNQDGSHLKLGTYTVYITAGLKNMVVERKGNIEHLDFRNASLRNQLRVRYQKLNTVKPAVEAKGDKPAQLAVTKWMDDGQTTYIPPNTWTGVYVGDGQRAVVDEMPT